MKEDRKDEKKGREGLEGRCWTNRKKVPRPGRPQCKPLIVPVRLHGSIAIVASHDHDGQPHFTASLNFHTQHFSTSIHTCSWKAPPHRPGVLSSLTHHLQPSPQNPHHQDWSERSPRPQRHNPRPQPSTSKHVLVALYPLEIRYSEVEIQSLVLLALLIPHVHPGNARSPSQEQGPLSLV